MKRDTKRLEVIARRAIFLLSRSPDPETEMVWAERRLREADLLGFVDPDPKDPVGWAEIAIGLNPDLMDQSLPWLEERDSHPEKAPTFENLVLSLIPSEGGL